MTDKKLLTTAIGTLSALSFSLGAIAADPSADNLFEAEALDRGFMSQQVNFEEGACGEGACGEGACGEGACGEDDEDNDDKDEEGACGEGACGEGACGEGACGEA
ncbi:MAG: low-complexity protein [Wenzhouxiangella sp.]|nr:MAG: low-complexity protein [Wenzhouxiangella sp.]